MRFLPLLVAALPSAAGELVTREALYSWVRSGLPRESETLHARHAADLLAALVEAVSRNIIPAPSGRQSGVLRFRDLATLDPDDWASALESSGVAVPEGTSLSAYVRTLAMKATGAYPDYAFRQRIERSGRTSTNERIGWLATVVARNPDVTFLELDYAPDSAALAAIDFGPLPAPARRQVIVDLDALQRIYAATGNVMSALQIMKAKTGLPLVEQARRGA